MIQHVACEGPGLLEQELINADWELDIRYMDNPGTKLPDYLDDYQAFIILGGPMGAYEEGRYPYLFKVQEYVREAVLKHIPTVGICLGGQLIARALGRILMI
jgi:GMP synthase-like glutamine amidotransferase